MHIDWKQLTPSHSIIGDDVEDTQLLKRMVYDAEAFLGSFSWCKRIEQSYFGCGIGGICAVFLFEIEPAREDVDRQLWVIVGDIPPAYLVTDDLATPEAALRVYIAEMRLWVNAVRQAKSIADVIPVNAPPTAESADDLDRRLSTIERLNIWSTGPTTIN